MVGGGTIVCISCGAQYLGTDRPEFCKLCGDIRSARRTLTQQWTDKKSISAEGYENIFKDKEPGIIAIGTQPTFGAGNRALLIQTGDGNVLWDCINVLTDEAKAKIDDLGGVSAVAVSHPHFYTAMADWAEAFDAPLYVHAEGKEWVTHPSDRIQYWSGDQMELFGGVTLLHLGGHFPSSTALHWDKGAGGRGILCASDTMQPVADKCWVTFMLSFSNYLPLPAAEVSRIGRMVASWPHDFDRLYGGWFGQVVDGDAKAKVLRSVDRYVGILEGTLQLKYT